MKSFSLLAQALYVLFIQSLFFLCIYFIYCLFRFLSLFISIRISLYLVIFFCFLCFSKWIHLDVLIFNDFPAIELRLVGQHHYYYYYCLKLSFIKVILSCLLHEQYKSLININRRLVFQSKQLFLTTCKECTRNGGINDTICEVNKRHMLIQIIIPSSKSSKNF